MESCETKIFLIFTFLFPDFTITQLARLERQRLTISRLKVLDRRDSFSRIAVIHAQYSYFDGLASQ